MKTYTTEEIKNLIKNDDKEKELFKSFISNKYPTLWKNKSDVVNEMIEWYFKTYSTYSKEMYVICNKKISTLTIKNRHYIKLKIYKSSSNLEYYTLIIGDKYRKDFKTLKEVYIEIEGSFKGSLFKLPKNVYSHKDGKSTQKYFKTEDNWYSNYNINGKDMCLGTFYYNSSNLDICSIALGGNDDYSISKDFWTYNDAKKHWDILCKKRFVNSSDLEGSYFSN